MRIYVYIDKTKDNTVVTPKSNTILPSITRRSLMYVAEHYLGLKAEEREIPLSEVETFKECALCGTAAVLSPVGQIDDHGKEIKFPSGEGMGEIHIAWRSKEKKTGGTNKTRYQAIVWGNKDNNWWVIIIVETMRNIMLYHYF